VNVGGGDKGKKSLFWFFYSPFLTVVLLSPVNGLLPSSLSLFLPNIIATAECFTMREGKNVIKKSRS
jgi:hypothetical protein